eukprot:TRINITY_DN3420_c0_g1_i1.p1 TRINITY_DN3420_c0_g1~~TRINITY_DN3420_c0_g1_i1.p1  ORF type:complete len:751 (+),score=185.85 TRINITY_DN3420_c0_g1_i1:169-2421(+)
MNTLTPEQKGELDTLEDPQSKLTWLLYYGNEDAVEYIIQELQVDVNHVPKNGMPPLYKTVVDNVPSMIDILIKHGANINWENSANKKSSPLYNACSKNYIKCVKALLKHKPNVDYRFHGKYTSLWKAAVEGYHEIVELLCIAGANTEIGGETSEDTPLFAATERGKARAVEALLKHGANTEATVNGHSIVYKAADHGKHEVLEVLFKHGISPDQHTQKTSSPLYVACQKGKEQVVEVLLKYKANVNYKFNVYYTPLWKAAYEGHAQIVKMLIDAGSSVSVQAPTGTPLFVAAQNGHDKVVEVLLRHNADTEVEVKGSSILAEACKNNHKLCVQLLLQYGAKFEVKKPQKIKEPEEQQPQRFVLKSRELNVQSKGFVHMLYHSGVIYLSYPNGGTTVTAWDANNGDIMRTFKGHNEEITALFIRDRTLYTASADKRVILSDVETGERIQTLSGHTKAITCMIYHEHTETDNESSTTKKILYTGSADSTVIAWEWVPDSRYTLKCKYSAHKSAITFMCAKNSQIYNMRYDVLYAAAVDGSVRAVDIETGKCLFNLVAHADAITSIVEYEDVLYTSSLDRTMKAFDRLTTKCIYTWNSDDPFLSMTIHTPSGCLVSSSANESLLGLQVWNCKTKELLYTLSVPPPMQPNLRPINKMYWSGNLLITGSEDGMIQSWEFVEPSQQDHPTKSKGAVVLHENKIETVEHESQFKLTQEIFNKLEGMEDQMIVMSKNIQDLYLILKNLETNLDKQKTK